jgi:hypothetical protein
VRLHVVELVRGEAAGLEQDAVRDGDLADVVQRGRLAQERELRLRRDGDRDEASTNATTTTQAEAAEAFARGRMTARSVPT